MAGNMMRPKNWHSFQHYKDRCPPWIKLHRDLLNNRDFMMLPTASKALAPLLWLLASESADGNFDGSIEELMFRLRMSETDIKTGLKSLIDKGFFVEDGAMLAKCKQAAIPETETETERETDFVAAPKGTAKAKRLSLDWVLPKDWGMWTLEHMGWGESAIRLEADRFKDYWTAKAGRDAAKLDWMATWRNWCRNSKTQPEKQTGSLLAGGI